MDKIYIIEDDENIRNLLKIALEGFGYEAEGFETAEEGLERIKEEVPSLAIFDWMLPGMDGVTAIRKIRQTDGLQELPIMLLTAKEKELDKVVGLDCGADDYMVKPFGVLELSARIRSLLRRAKREEKKDTLTLVLTLPSRRWRLTKMRRLDTATASSMDEAVARGCDQAQARRYVQP